MQSQDQYNIHGSKYQLI